MIEWLECLNEPTQAFIGLVFGIYFIISFFVSVAWMHYNGEVYWEDDKVLIISTLPGMVVVYSLITYWIITSIINMITCLF